MTKQEIENQIAELQAKLNQMEEAKEFPDPLTEPLQYGQNYYFASLPDEVIDDYWSGYHDDYSRLQAGLVFPGTDKGRKAAEARAERGLVQMVEVEKPLTEAPGMAERYVVAFPGDLRVYFWSDDEEDNKWLKNGQAFRLTAGGAAGALLKLRELS